MFLKWLKNVLAPPDVFGGQRDARWREVRAAHIEKEPVCQACGRATKLDVHHIIPVAFDKTRELDPENLITLCSQPCHFVFGHFMSYYCYNKDVRKIVAAYRAAYEERRCLSTDVNGNQM